MAIASDARYSVHQGVNTLQGMLDLMAERVNSSTTKQQVAGGRIFMLRNLAMEIVSGSPTHGDASEDEPIARIFWWVKNNIEYRHDPPDYDSYHAAGRTIEAKGGYCDDQTILVAALLNSIGFVTGAKVVSPDGQAWHVYPWVGVRSMFSPSRYVALDTTQPESYPGWEPAAYHRKFQYMAQFKRDKAVGLRRVS